MAAPMKEMSEDPTSKVLRAWKVSDADAMSGQTTAWTSERLLGTQVCA